MPPLMDPINVDLLPAIEHRSNHPTFSSFSTVFGRYEVVAVVTADFETTANWLNRILEDPGEKIVGFTTIGLESAKHAYAIALSYCNNVLIYQVKEAVKMGLVPPQFNRLLDNPDVKLVCVDVVRNKTALTLLGFKVGRCEFLNIAHNLRAHRETFSHVTMFDILAEHLDLMYQDVLPAKLQSDVLNDRECILLSLYSFGPEEVYARLTNKSAEISVLAHGKNRFLIQMGPNRFLKIGF
ncbi:hypothetical protein MTR_7g099140 [Medicago truncatula]|uniref:Uncharacterized protein n=1 Tax=Medicago truncatula TaxID=3880 RepID=G7KYJ3_MEDTR|nr:hypothetical protein MTR_7g099140 [Medicago truncatula]